MNPLVQQVEAKLKELAQETDAVRKSAQFQQYLDAMAKFHDYSLHNQLLIFFRIFLEEKTKEVISPEVY